MQDMFKFLKKILFGDHELLLKILQKEKPHRINPPNEHFPQFGKLKAFILFAVILPD